MVRKIKNSCNHQATRLRNEGGRKGDGGETLHPVWIRQYADGAGSEETFQVLGESSLCSRAGGRPHRWSLGIAMDTQTGGTCYIHMLHGSGHRHTDTDVFIGSCPTLLYYPSSSPAPAIKGVHVSKKILINFHWLAGAINPLGARLVWG